MTYYKAIIRRINNVKDTIENFTINNVVSFDIRDTCDGTYFEMKYYTLSRKECRKIEPMRGIVSIELEEE